MAIIFLILALSAIAWFMGQVRASSLMSGRKKALHSLPRYHGWFMAICAFLPALFFVIIWSNIAPALASYAVMADPMASNLPTDSMAMGRILSEARMLSQNSEAFVTSDLARQLAPLYAQWDSHYAWIGTLAAALLCLAGGLFAFTRIRPDFRARTKVERFVMLMLLLSSLVAILATLGIVASLVFESFRFFSYVSPLEFFGTIAWNPEKTVSDGLGNGYGALPLFWGTVFIGAIIAMLIAIPFGLMSAIYLTQYANKKVRKIIKPVLEVLAGVPTVVYGYFAALTIAPAIRDGAVALGVSNASSKSALAAGLVMGIMIIPFVSSMADNSIAAVPQSMRDGSLAMGATRSETIKKVLIPAALPGVIGGVLLAVSRAIGETMIVVMAAGFFANLTANPFESITTVTVQIVQLLTGDTDFQSPMTLAAFALGLSLFVVTLLLNLVALHIVRKYREAYD